jgi:coenzyme F420-0:L-glutamate ligase/coenzyme F420-1:gamma-L-glutamate ligase
LKSFTIVAIENFPLIKAGDNLAEALVEAAKKDGVRIENGDIIVITQKVFSKAEKRIVNFIDVVPSEEAVKIGRKIGKSPRFVELVLRETNRSIKISPEVFLVEDKRGFICINAGIDKSNVQGDGNFALLPANPDVSASLFRGEIKKLTGNNVAVLICDTYSRPFRRGQVNFAIGISGMKPFRDYRMKKDLFGQVLRVKNIAVADEIAATAELLMGQATEARPVVILKNLTEFVESCETCSAKELQISRVEDLFNGAL